MRETGKTALALLSDWRLDALHVVGNALLLGSAALWLLIPEAHTWQLVFAGVSALLLVLAFAWLHCGTLAHGLTPDRATLFADFRRALRHVPIFLVLALALFFLMDWVAELSDKSWQISGYLFTLLPNWLRSAVGGENGLNRWVEFKIAALNWILLPALFLPWLAATAAHGLRSQVFRAALRCYARWKYWLGVIVVGLVGVFVPRILMDWTPGHGLRTEAISMGVRLTIAYLVALLSWLVAAAVVGRTLREAVPIGDGGGQSLA